MYLHNILSKIQDKHGITTAAYIKFYSLPDSLQFIGTGRSQRLDQVKEFIVSSFYEAYGLRENPVPLEIKTFRLGEPMESSLGYCTMYRIYQERFDGFHQVALVTVLNKEEYTDFEWMKRYLEENSSKPDILWWLEKDL